VKLPRKHLLFLSLLAHNSLPLWKITSQPVRSIHRLADIYFQEFVNRGSDNKITHLWQVSRVEIQKNMRAAILQKTGEVQLVTYYFVLKGAGVDKPRNQTLHQLYPVLITTCIL